MIDPARPAPLSYSAVWNDAGRTLATNAGLLAAIAGVFIFLPAVLEARFFPPPEGWTSMREWMELTQEHVSRNLPWMLLSMILNLIGIITIYLMLLPGPRLTVGSAVGRALAILPFYFIMQLVVGIAWGIGFVLLIVPFLFLVGKLVLAAPILIGETPRAPFTAIQRSWALSSGRAWSITGLVVMVYAAALVFSMAVRIGFGILILIALGRQGVGGLLLSILQGLVVAVVSVVFTVLVATIYRALSPATAAAQPVR
jgi:hypothetical protein